MLSHLRIDNLAVVESVVLDLAPGLNVLTGSTGAGKSLILGAVNLLMGERSSPDVIRQGADEAFVEATFTGVAAEQLLDFPAVAGDGVVTVRRRVSRGGRSHAEINGRPATVKDLRGVCSRLIEPHGQHEQLRVRDPENHIAYLDVFAANLALQRRFAEALAGLRAARAELDRFDAETARLREKRELYLHRVEEIERVAPRAGEKTSLETSARLIANAERIHAALSEASAVLYDDDDAAATLIGRAQKRLAAIAGVDDRIASIHEALDQAHSLIAAAAGDARSILDSLEFEPADVERVQERLEVLTRLERRYQSTIDAIVADKDEWKRALDGLDDSGENRALRVRAVVESAASVASAGQELSRTRERAAAELGPLVSTALHELGMRAAALRVVVTRANDPGSDVTVDGEHVAVFEDGLDVVRMRIRTNPGETEGALETVASSGELSRVALALKEYTASRPGGATLILDEIDAGVGADLGDALAEKLLALASRHQIVCITHMPQIAARGESHLVVLKETDGDRTRVRVRPVEDEERTREIARMLGGEEGSERRLALAAEMLVGRKADRSRSRVRP